MFQYQTNACYSMNSNGEIHYYYKATILYIELTIPGSGDTFVSF